MIINIELNKTKYMRIRLILILLLAALSTETTAGGIEVIELSPLCRDLARYGLPSSNARLLCKSKFLVGYSDDSKTPLWTIERLGRSRIPISKGREIRSFEVDTDIPEQFRASLIDYVGSGFDRGHLVAAGNYVNDPKAYRETYLLSNVAPQIGIGFNRGIWRLLEEEIRNLAQCTNELFVYTALVLPTPGASRLAIGRNRIGIPVAFIKVLYLPEQRKAISFFAENRAHRSANITSLLRSVDTVEAISSFDFLEALPTSIETVIEDFTPAAPWSITRKNNHCLIQTN